MFIWVIYSLKLDLFLSYLIIIICEYIEIHESSELVVPCRLRLEHCHHRHCRVARFWCSLRSLSACQTVSDSDSDSDWPVVSASCASPGPPPPSLVRNERLSPLYSLSLWLLSGLSVSHLNLESSLRIFFSATLPPSLSLLTSSCNAHQIITMRNWKWMNVQGTVWQSWLCIFACICVG